MSYYMNLSCFQIVSVSAKIVLYVSLVLNLLLLKIMN